MKPALASCRSYCASGDTTVMWRLNKNPVHHPVAKSRNALFFLDAQPIYLILDNNFNMSSMCQLNAGRRNVFIVDNFTEILILINSNCVQSAV